MISSKHPSGSIRLRGVRQNNLKNFDLDLPLGRLIVITGLSGSGKSSLAFDTLFAEGQRRYIETFSPYARQFFDRMDKPQADLIDGIPPAIAIEQRNTVRTTRSTVGTMTEICDYVKVMWPHMAVLHCEKCGQPVRKDNPGSLWQALVRGAGSPEASVDACVTFAVALSDKLSLDESLALIGKQGYQRIWMAGEILRLEEIAEAFKAGRPARLVVVQDRICLSPARRARFVEACEQAFHFGKGRLAVGWPKAEVPAAGKPCAWEWRSFSNRLHCADCDIHYPEPAAALFSFNHPLGACPACHGFGRIIAIDYQKAVPDRSLTLAQGLVKPWRSGFSAECQADLMKFCRLRRAPVDVPFDRMPKHLQDWVIDGDPDYGSDKQHEWPHAWYGVKGYFHWMESKSYKMHMRVLLSRYRTYAPCPQCQGRRFQPAALHYRTPGHPSLTIADLYRLPIREALDLFDQLSRQKRFNTSEPLGLALHEIQSRLEYLVEVGLGYLTLDRPTRTLSGGETERVNLTACLGTRLVNTLFVLDEPSVGLHARDTEKLVRILQRLRDTGNTVVVVEHEASVIRAADQVVDLGPGSGENGGHLVFQGSYKDLLNASLSLTAQYLSGTKRIEAPDRRPVLPDSGQWLTLRNARRHNLKNLTVQIPLRRLVCITGVSGSGKTTLAREELFPALRDRLDTGVSANQPASEEADSAGEVETAAAGKDNRELLGWENLERVLLVEQSPLGKTPRSNPAVYAGAFDDLRELFARSDMALQRGLNASAFSFNSLQGQCERCRGAGFEKIEMQFLSDVFVRCPECNGRRYRSHILEVTLEAIEPKASAAEKAEHHHWSIADLLEATIDEAVHFLRPMEDAKPARHARQKLQLLQEVGLGYLRLGQPINTLSCGECQRLKLVRHLAEFDQTPSAPGKSVLFLFDEPTTGLHFEDVRVLLRVFQRLVDRGHSVLVIEHHLDVIEAADWVLDLGPEAGEGGGQIVAQGTPEQVEASPESYTGQALRTRRRMST